MKLFLIWPIGSGAELFVQFGRGYYEEQFCEIILNLGQWFRRDV